MYFQEMAFSCKHYLVEHLNPFNLAYLHVVERFGKSIDSSFDFNELRVAFNGAYIANGGYTAASAETSLANNHSDFISFGVPFLANSDLPERFRLGAALNEADQTSTAPRKFVHRFYITKTLP